MPKKEKRWLETFMTREAVSDFGMDIKKLIKVRRNGETYYVYKELVDEDVYKEVNREDWRLQKQRQRMFKDMAEKDQMIISLDQSNENYDFELVSEINVEEEAIKRIMLEALEEEINILEGLDKKLMKLVFHSDLNQREIANILGVSQETVNLKIKKNKEILRKKLIGE